MPAIKDEFLSILGCGLIAIRVGRFESQEPVLVTDKNERPHERSSELDGTVNLILVRRERQCRFTFWMPQPDFISPRLKAYPDYYADLLAYNRRSADGCQRNRFQRNGP